MTSQRVDELQEWIGSIDPLYRMILRAVGNASRRTRPKEAVRMTAVFKQLDSYYELRRDWPMAELLLAIQRLVARDVLTVEDGLFGATYLRPTTLGDRIIGRLIGQLSAIDVPDLPNTWHLELGRQTRRPPAEPATSTTWDPHREWYGSTTWQPVPPPPPPPPPPKK